MAGRNLKIDQFELDLVTLCRRCGHCAGVAFPRIRFANPHQRREPGGVFVLEERSGAHGALKQADHRHTAHREVMGRPEEGS